MVSNDVNTTTNLDEPMLRLVQTETGEQFYEFLINNLVEKSSNISLNTSDNKDESTSISEHVTNACLDIKNVNEEVNNHEQRSINKRYTQ